MHTFLSENSPLKDYNTNLNSLKLIKIPGTNLLTGSTGTPSLFTWVDVNDNVTAETWTDVETEDSTESWSNV